MEYMDLMQWISASFSTIISREMMESVRIYYLPNMGGRADKERINDTPTLKQKLSIVSNDSSFKSAILVSVEENSPKNSPCNDNISLHSSNVSALTSTTRGSMQDNFHSRVLKRDNEHCVFCGEDTKAHLKAAHIFDVFRANYIPPDDKKFLQQYELIDLYDTSNGITLCADCHFAFDALLCCVDVVDDNGVAKHILKVAEALKQSAEYGEKWRPLDGTAVRVPTDPVLLKHWPPDALFKFRKSKFDEYKMKRDETAKDRPYVCRCGMRTKSEQGLARHIRSKKCLTRQTSSSVRYSNLFTPDKTSAVPKKLQSPAQSEQIAHKRRRQKVHNKNTRDRVDLMKSP